LSRRPPIPCDELCRAYAEGQSSTAIAQRYKCSPTTIIKYLRRCGLSIRSSRFQATAIPEAALRRLYLEGRLPLPAIVAYFGVSISTINNKRRRYNISTRPQRVWQPGADAVEL
jgi:uncharacterized protein YjcR